MRILASPAFSNQKANPYNWLLYSNTPDHDVVEYSHKGALKGGYDVLHYHWPDGYVNMKTLAKTLRRMAILAGAVAAAKLRGKKIVWTVHNLEPHDPAHPALLAFFMRRFVAVCDGLIFLSEASQRKFHALYPSSGAVEAVIPHGHYRDVYPQSIKREEAKSRLDIPSDKKLLLFLGGIKPYKNVETLIAEFLTLDDPSALLLIAGHADADMRARLETLTNGKPSVKTVLSFIPDEDLPLYFGAADLVILPFRAILNSGSVMLALSFDRPVVAPAMGSITELAESVGPNWVTTYTGEFNGGVLKDALARLDEPGRAETCTLDAFSWDRIGRQLHDLYNAL